MNARQQRALGAVASGLSLRESAKVGGYKNLVTVCRLARSEAGKRYLKDIAERVDSENIFSIQERLTQLKNIAKVHQFSNPAVALGAVKEANRLCS